MKFRPGTAGAEMCEQGVRISIPGLCRWCEDVPLCAVWFKVSLVQVEPGSNGGVQGRGSVQHTRSDLCYPDGPGSQSQDKCAVTMCRNSASFACNLR